MIAVYRSKYTPGIKASETRFAIGEVVDYRLRKAHKVVQVKITSGPMWHPEAPGDGLGYEGQFSDTGEIGFASNEGIVNWPGKTETVGQLNALLGNSR